MCNPSKSCIHTVPGQLVLIPLSQVFLVLSLIMSIELHYQYLLLLLLLTLLLSLSLLLFLLLLLLLLYTFDIFLSLTENNSFLTISVSIMYSLVNLCGVCYKNNKSMYMYTVHVRYMNMYMYLSS